MLYSVSRFKPTSVADADLKPHSPNNTKNTQYWERGKGEEMKIRRSLVPSNRRSSTIPKPCPGTKITRRSPTLLDELLVFHTHLLRGEMGRGKKKKAYKHEGKDRKGIRKKGGVSSVFLCSKKGREGGSGWTFCKGKKLAAISSFFPFLLFFFVFVCFTLLAH